MITINSDREIACKDLHLRPLAMSDTANMFDILSDPQSMKYWSDKPLTDISDAEKSLTEDLESDAAGNSLCWAITLKGQNQLVGKCILFQFSKSNRRAEIGFIINRKYWRQGLTTQAVNAVIDFAFNSLQLHRIEADVDPENSASLALLEKLGFKREGLFRDRWFVNGQWSDSVMLGLLNDAPD